MHMFRHTVLIAAIAALGTAPAVASQGPGTTGGTAGLWDKVMLAVVIGAVICVGFAVKFRSR